MVANTRHDQMIIHSIFAVLAYSSNNLFYWNHIFIERGLFSETEHKLVFPTLRHMFESQSSTCLHYIKPLIWCICYVLLSRYYFFPSWITTWWMKKKDKRALPVFRITEADDQLRAFFFFSMRSYNCYLFSRAIESKYM